MEITHTDIQAAVWAFAPATKTVKTSAGIKTVYKKNCIVSYTNSCQVYFAKVQYQLNSSDRNDANQNDKWGGEYQTYMQMSTGSIQETIYTMKTNLTQGVLPHAITIGGESAIFFEQGIQVLTPTIQINFRKKYTTLPTNWSYRTAQLKEHTNTSSIFGFPAHQVKFQSCVSSQYPYFPSGGGDYYSGTSLGGELTYKYTWRPSHEAIVIPAAMILNGTADWTFAANPHSWDKFYAKGVPSPQQGDAGTYVIGVAGVGGGGTSFSKQRKLIYSGYIRPPNCTDADISPL